MEENSQAQIVTPHLFIDETSYHTVHQAATVRPPQVSTAQPSRRRSAQLYTYDDADQSAHPGPFTPRIAPLSEILPAGYMSTTPEAIVVIEHRQGAIGDDHMVPASGVWLKTHDTRTQNARESSTAGRNGSYLVTDSSAWLVPQGVSQGSPCSKKRGYSKPRSCVCLWKTACACSYRRRSRLMYSLISALVHASFNAARFSS